MKASASPAPTAAKPYTSNRNRPIGPWSTWRIATSAANPSSFPFDFTRTAAKSAPEKKTISDGLRYSTRFQRLLSLDLHLAFVTLEQYNDNQALEDPKQLI